MLYLNRVTHLYLLFLSFFISLLVDVERVDVAASPFFHPLVLSSLVVVSFDDVDCRVDPLGDDLGRDALIALPSY